MEVKAVLIYCGLMGNYTIYKQFKYEKKNIPFHNWSFA